MNNIYLSYAQHWRLALASAPLGFVPAWCTCAPVSFTCAGKCFEHNEHLKRCIRYLQAQTPSRGAALQEVTSGRAHLPLFPARAGPCPECYWTGIFSAQVFRRRLQDCSPVYPGAQPPEKREQSLLSLTGDDRREEGQNGRPRGCVYSNWLLSTARSEASRHLLPTCGRSTQAPWSRLWRETHTQLEQRKQQGLTAAWPPHLRLSLPPPPTRGVHSVYTAHPFSKNLVFPKVFRVQRKVGVGRDDSVVWKKAPC